jgi:hypothetical protein
MYTLIIIIVMQGSCFGQNCNAYPAVGAIPGFATLQTCRAAESALPDLKGDGQYKSVCVFMGPKQ